MTDVELVAEARLAANRSSKDPLRAHWSDLFTKLADEIERLRQIEKQYEDMLSAADDRKFD